MVEQNMQDDAYDDEEPYGSRQSEDRTASQFAVPHVDRKDGPCIGKVLDERPEYGHGAQGNDEGCHLELGDHNAVQRTTERAEDQCKQEGQHDSHRRSRAEEVEEEDGDASHECRHGPDRKIDAAGDDDQRHPQGDDACIGYLPENVRKVPEFEEVGPPDDGGDDHQDDECHPQRVVLETKVAYICNDFIFTHLALHPFYPCCLEHNVLFCDLSFLQAAGHSSFTHDIDPVAHADYLFHFRRDDDATDLILCKAVDELVDFLLRVDVDTARRLIKYENLGIGIHPAGKIDLLLVAAAEEPEL